MKAFVAASNKLERNDFPALSDRKSVALFTPCGCAWRHRRDLEQMDWKNEKPDCQTHFPRPTNRSEATPPLLLTKRSARLDPFSFGLKTETRVTDAEGAKVDGGRVTTKSFR